LKLSPEEQAQVQELYTAYSTAKTPQEKAAAQQNLQMYGASLMIRRGRMPSLPDAGRRVDPLARQQLIKALMDNNPNMTNAQAQMAADTELGGAASMDLGNVVSGLQTLNTNAGQNRPGARPTQPVDRIGNAVIGPLTPQAWIDEAAALGNQNAIRYKQQALENAAMGAAARGNPLNGIMP
jgi:hypothetical protein